jgi:ABC-type multidrug transport system ATPase subunit
VLEIRGLGVSFPGAPAPALRDVDLRLDRAKMVVVGANGSGKTTLIRSVLGLVPPTSGSISIAGQDVDRIHGQTGVSTNLGEVYRLLSLPVRDLVRVMARLKGGDPAEMEGHLHDFELDQVLGKRMHELSTGQQKLVGDLFAICFHPNLVLLDEPFDNVDFTRRRRLVRILRELPGDILLNTHELDLLGSFEGWALGLMFEGRLLGPFSVAELDRLYLTKGAAAGALAMMATSLGTFSVTRDAGDRPVKSATSLNALVEALT